MADSREGRAGGDAAFGAGGFPLAGDAGFVAAGAVGLHGVGVDVFALAPLGEHRFHVRAEGAPAERFPLDTGYPQAFTNPVWVIVGNAAVRDRASAEYALKWIDRLQALADAWPGWRSQKEKDHVYAQFEEARQVYRRFAAEDAATAN